MRGATVKYALKGNLNEFQSTRPMRGATSAYFSNIMIASVSIHAPHAGRDLAAKKSGDVVAEFQSTRPMRGATA